MNQLIKTIIKKTLYILFLSLIFLSCRNSIKEDKILIVGDSLLLGYKLPEKKSSLFLIKKKLKGEIYQVCEFGMTTNFFEKQLEYNDKIINNDYSIIILELGANDYLLGISADNVKKSYDSLIKTISKKKTKIFIINFIDESMYNNDLCNIILLQQYDQMFHSLEKDNIIIIDNIWNSNFSNMNYKIDAYHPNIKESRIIAKKILKIILTEKRLNK